ncbi:MULTISPECIES: AraC family transcriptional regulator [Rhodomicrobium]|uniref:helix-turn-helix domain-containing protein n=1 Tax=Rhodomicrobium TaxID=1068 RepID=UPI000B4C0823|nr:MULTISPECIES: AraC family transcriptional regulator [Rhodomicrobium]
MFRPRMKSRVSGISVIGELKWRAWNGVVADVWSVNCAADACGEYYSEDPRLFVVLEMDGPGGIALQGESERAGGMVGRQSISYIPAGYPIRGSVDGAFFMRHLDLHLDVPALMRRFGGELDAERLEIPRLGFQDARIAALPALIAAECTSDAPLHDLYGDGLLGALLTALFGVERKTGRRRSQLSGRQLQRVKAYIEDHCLENIRLSELAELAGLSPTYFSHAFKASTGVAPYRWHMRARIRKVQRLLLENHAPITDVAAVAGFADQAHLTRVFKQHVGLTPAAWLRDHAQ